MRIETITPQELGPSEAARWAELASADPALGNPFLSASYAKAVGAVRRDARVAVIEDGGAIVGFFAVQRPSAFAAMPLGAPMTDVQALIAAPGLDVRPADLCRALKVGRIDFTGMPTSLALARAGAQGATGSWIADVSGGSAAYLSALRARRNDTVRQHDKKRRKLEREGGAVAFSPLSRDRAHFEALLAWKQAQCRITGQPPVWETKWVLALLDRLWETDAPDLKPALFTLTVDGRLAAANFFLAGARVLHDWLIGHSDAYSAHSPGVLLTRQVCEWAGDHGYDEVDLGPGDYQYKRQLTLGQRELAYGFLGGASVSAGLRGGFYALRGALEAHGGGKLAQAPGKAMRRLDVMRGLGLPVLSPAHTSVA